MKSLRNLKYSFSKCEAATYPVYFSPLGHLAAQSELQHREAQGRRRRLKEDSERLIQEVEKMERDLALDPVR